MELLVLYFHIAFLCVAACGIALADHEAFEWIFGMRKVVDRSTAQLAHWIVAVGITGLILTGLYLFWPLRNYILGEPLFWLKMAFVAALVVNSFAIEYLMTVATTRSFASLSRKQQAPFIASGLLSTASWIGACCVALILF